MATKTRGRHVPFASAVALAAPPRPVVVPWPSPVQAAPLEPITFPATPLRTKAWIALGADPAADPTTWLWEEISSYIRYVDGVSTNVGRADWSSRVNSGQARLRLDNRDGRFSRRNPASPYHHLLSRNTPIRLAVDPGDGDHTRFEGFVNEWPTRWDVTGNESTVPVVCGGPLRRLQRGEVLKSPLRRAIEGSVPIRYWPLEDGANADQAATGLATHRGMVLSTGSVTFASNSAIAGSKPLPNFNGAGSLTGAVGVGSSTAWAVEFVGVLPDSFYVPIMWTAGGTLTDWHFVPIGGSVRVQAFESNGTLNIVCEFTPDTFADPHNWVVTAAQDGADVDVQVLEDGVLVDSGTITTQTLGAIRSVGVNPFGNGVTDPFVLGHVAIYNGATMDGHTDGFTGYSGEQAHIRMARVCEQEGVHFFTAASSTAELGPQPIGTLLDVLRDAEQADLGVLYERGFGLGYQANSERYNATVGLALDWGQLAEPPEPADDDQRYINRWTVARSDGSSSTVGDTALVAQDDVYASSQTVNVEEDHQLDDIASFLVHRDTVDEDRWTLELQFARNPELIAGWTALGYGARLSVADPFPASPNDIDVVIEGHRERWDQFTWEAQLDTTPASIYTIGVYGDTPVVRRYDTAGSELAAAFIAGTDTSMSVATTRGPIWIEDASHFPFNINISGVILTVTAISGGASPQTFTVVQTPVNGVSSPFNAGTALSLAEPSYYAL